MTAGAGSVRGRRADGCDDRDAGGAGHGHDQGEEQYEEDHDVIVTPGWDSYARRVSSTLTSSASAGPPWYTPLSGGTSP